MEKSKNSRGEKSKIHGLKIHGLKIHTGLYGWACVGLFCGPFLWACFPSQKQLQSNEKQTNTKTAKDIFFIVFSLYHDMKNKRKSKLILPIYIRYEIFCKKYQKKFAELKNSCTFAIETKKQGIMNYAKIESALCTKAIEKYLNDKIMREISYAGYQVLVREDEENWYVDFQTGLGEGIYSKDSFSLEQALKDQMNIYNENPS
jgi:hypothetical protein